MYFLLFSTKCIKAKAVSVDFRFKKARWMKMLRAEFARNGTYSHARTSPVASHEQRYLDLDPCVWCVSQGRPGPTSLPLHSSISVGHAVLTFPPWGNALATGTGQTAHRTASPHTSTETSQSVGSNETEISFVSANQTWLYKGSL